MAKAGGGRTGWLREAPLRKGDGGRDLNDKNSVLQSVLQGERTAMWQRSQGRKVIGELEEPPETAVAGLRGGESGKEGGRWRQMRGRGGLAPEPEQGT